jgi:hypothetical protein
MVTGGIVKAVANYAIYNEYSGSTGTVSISGGTVESVTGGAIYNYSGGIINISGSALVTSGNTSDAGGTIYNSNQGSPGGNIRISGGTVRNTANGSAVSNRAASTYGALYLSGAPAPVIEGRISGFSSGKIEVFYSGEQLFEPEDNVYTLQFAAPAANFVAVANGYGFLSNFAVYNEGYVLAENVFDLVLAAAPTNAVTFNLNGGVGTVPGSVYVPAAGGTVPAAQKPATAGFTKSGYVSDGDWYTDIDGTNKFIFGVTMVTSDTTLYLKWRDRPVYTVSFDLNGGTGTAPAAIDVDSGTVISAASKPSTAGFTMEGFTNDSKWYINSNGTGEFVFGTTLVTSDMTLYLKWIEDEEIISPVYTVSFNLNGGTGTAPAAIADVDSGSVISAALKPSAAGFTREGYTHNDKWYIGAAGTNEFVFGTTTVDSNMTLYLKWIEDDVITPMYTVSFNLNGGDGTVPTAIADVDSGSVVLAGLKPSTAGITRDGYTHGDKWYTDIAGTNEFVFGTTKVDSSMTLYLKWIEDDVIPPVPVLGGLRFITPVSNADFALGTQRTVLNAGPSSVFEVGIQALDTLGVAFKSNAVSIDLTMEISGLRASRSITTDASTGVATFRHFQESGVTGGVITFIAQMSTTRGTVRDTAILQITPPSVQTPPPYAISRNDELTPVSAPVSVSTGEFTAGPNPVIRSSGQVNIFRVGKQITDAALTIFDASGGAINKIAVSDRGAVNKTSSAESRRVVGSWNLRDKKGRAVSEGTYLVKGTVTTLDGQKERVSLMIGIR